MWRTPDAPRPDPAHLTPVEARERLAALIHEARSGVDHRRIDATLGESVDLWLGRAGRTCKPTTLRGYASLGRALGEHFGVPTPVRSLTRARIEGWVCEQAQRIDAGQAEWAFEVRRY